MIRLGVIGCGNISGTHAARFHKENKRLTIAAGVDIDIPKAKKFAEQFPGCKVSADYRTILGDVDAVLLSLPHHLHYPIGMECIKAGKHILMEKPLANTEKECVALIKAAEKAGVTFMVAYCMRYHPLIVRMKEIINQKIYGNLFQFSYWTEQYTKYADGHWAHAAETVGGGQLFSHGCHYIDIMLAFLGEPVSGAHVGSNFCTPWMEKEGTSNVCMKFKNGALGYHFGTWGARGTRLRYGFHAHFEKGMIEGDIATGKLILHTGLGETLDSMDPGKMKEEVLIACEAGKHVEGEMKEFLDCIEQKKIPLTDGWSGLQSLRVIWKMYEAEHKGRMADLRGLGLPGLKKKK